MDESLQRKLYRKKSFSIFPFPAGMSLNKLSLGGNNLYMTSLFPLRESLLSDIPGGDGNIEKFFLRCRAGQEWKKIRGAPGWVAHDGVTQVLDGEQI